MLVKFEQIVWSKVLQTTRNFELFDKKRVFLTIFDKELTPFLKDVSVAKNIV